MPENVNANFGASLWLKTLAFKMATDLFGVCVCVCVCVLYIKIMSWANIKWTNIVYVRKTGLHYDITFENVVKYSIYFLVM